jgi:hypothetical protein
LTSLPSLLAALRRRYPFILAFGLIGALLGVAAAAARPTTQSSTAVTTLTSRNLDLPIDSIYSVNQMIRVTMPNYLAYGQDFSVVNAAAAAAGIDPGAAEGGLALTRDPDANVISWRFTVSETADAQKGLVAAIDQFENVVESSAPKSPAGKPLVAVEVNRPPSVASVRSVSRPLAGFAGALVGLLSALAVVIARARQTDTVTSRDSIELELRTPVVAEMGDDDASRAQGWRYAAAALAKGREPQRILVLGGRVAPLAEDVRLLQDSVTDRLPTVMPAVVVRTLSADSDIPRLAGGADGVVVILVRGVDSTGEIGGQMRSLRHLCRGHVVAILDDSENAKSTAAAPRARVRERPALRRRSVL